MPRAWGRTWDDAGMWWDALQKALSEQRKINLLSLFFTSLLLCSHIPSLANSDSTFGFSFFSPLCSSNIIKKKNLLPLIFLGLE